MSTILSCACVVRIMDYLPPNVKRTKPQTWQWAERPLGIAMGETRPDAITIAHNVPNHDSLHIFNPYPLPHQHFHTFQPINNDSSYPKVYNAAITTRTP
ncbi:MAG: hypothetical protein IKO72_05620 [Kiritimatiellae bacterium]|nr:hypothetical protein [Kiritimatiellia bacterium]